MPAITTPFDANQDLDLRALGELLEWLEGEGNARSGAGRNDG